MDEFQELLQKSDKELLEEYAKTYSGTHESKRDTINLIFNYRYSKRMICLTWVIGILTFLLLVITIIQIYLILSK